MTGRLEPTEPSRSAIAAAVALNVALMTLLGVANYWMIAAGMAEATKDAVVAANRFTDAVITFAASLYVAIAANRT